MIRIAVILVILDEMNELIFFRKKSSYYVQVTPLNASASSGVGPRGLQTVLSVRVDLQRYEKRGVPHKIEYTATYFNV